MASIKDLKKRIGSVKNTQQTTRAMKLVSAAKLRRAQEAIHANRPYANELKKLMAVLSQMTETVSSPLTTTVEGAEQKTLHLIVSSDRGLCGNFNGSIIKTAQKISREEDIFYAYIGKKAYEFLRTKMKSQPVFYKEFGNKIRFARAKEIADQLVELYLTGKYSEIKIVYNEFQNAISQKVVVETFLPLTSTAATKEDAVAPDLATDLTVVKPSSAFILETLMKKYVTIQMYRILLESQAGEHGARMSSMENATRNAGEMIQKLSLQYNKQRQASITKELLEIISGSESQKGEG